MSRAVLVRCSGCGLEVTGVRDAGGVVRASSRSRPEPDELAVPGLCIACAGAPAAARRGRPVRLPLRAPAIVGEAGAVVYANRSRWTGYRLRPGTRGLVSEVLNRGFVLFTFGSGAAWCHLELERCRASHVHTALVKAAQLEPAQ